MQYFVIQIILLCNFGINILQLGKCVPKLLQSPLFLVYYVSLYVCIYIYILCYILAYLLDSILQIWSVGNVWYVLLNYVNWLMYVLIYVKLCVFDYKLCNIVLLCSIVLAVYCIVLYYCTISYCIITFPVFFFEVE